MIQNCEEREKMSENALEEVIGILKDLPEERQAYLNGYAAGMAAEHRLQRVVTDQRSA